MADGPEYQYMTVESARDFGFRFLQRITGDVLLRFGNHQETLVCAEHIEIPMRFDLNTLGTPTRGEFFCPEDGCDSRASHSRGRLNSEDPVIE